MKLVIIDKQEIIKYKEQEIKVPIIILSILGIMFNRHKSKWDDVILITGEVGTAKSTMAKLLGGLWQILNKKELTLYNFTWSAKGISDFVDNKGNDNEVIIYDEAITGGTGRASLTREGNKLKISLVVGRRKRHLYIMIVDEIQEFSKKIISRSSLLIDMRTLMVKGEKKRGYFKLYNEKELKELYWLLKEQRIKYISEYNATLKPFYVFKDCTNKFINEEEYENAKIEQTKQQQQEEDIIDKRSEALIKSIKYLKNQGLNYPQIGDIIGYGAEQVGRLARTTTKN